MVRTSLSSATKQIRYSSDDKPTFNQNFTDRYGFSNQSTFDGIDLIQPRVGFEWFATDDSARTPSLKSPSKPQRSVRLNSISKHAFKERSAGLDSINQHVSVAHSSKPIVLLPWRSRLTPI